MKSSPFLKMQKPESCSRLFTPERIPQIWKKLAKVDFAFFCQYSHRGFWKPAPHLEKVCSLLEQVEQGELKRLILTMPPRHGKSMTVTETFPAWFLGRNPDKKVIEVSYGDDLAKGFGDKCRRKIEEYGPLLWGINIDFRNANKSNWGIYQRRGGMVSAGVGGPLTGKGADLMIIDDPVKNRQEADSQTYRDRIWSEWTSTLATRLHPGASVIVVLTRWHEDDLAGRLLQAEPDRWELYNFPAFAGGGPDPLNRKEGEPLWPERYSKEELEQIKQTIGPRDWGALYQGNPSPAEGGLFKRQSFKSFKYHPGPNIVELLGETSNKTYSLADCKVFQTCDVAGTTKTNSDFFVLGTFALTPNNELLVLEIYRDRLEGPDQPGLLKRKYDEWKPIVQGIESKSMGLTLYQSMLRSGLPIIELKPGTRDKYTRALSMAPRYQSGMVYHRIDAHWREELELELCEFPMGKHDDQVDVIAYAGEVIDWVLQSETASCGAYVIT